MATISETMNVPAVSVEEGAGGTTEGTWVGPEHPGTPLGEVDTRSAVDVIFSATSGGVADATSRSEGGTEASLRTRVRVVFRGRAAALLRRAIEVKMGEVK